MALKNLSLNYNPRDIQLGIALKDFKNAINNIINAINEGMVTPSPAYQTIAPRTITSELLDGNIVDTRHLREQIITTKKIVDEAMTEAKIALGAVTEGKIAVDAVTANKIIAGAIIAIKIAAGAITTDKLDALAVTADKIAALTITADKIAANAIETGKINALAVTADKIAAGSITTDKLAALAVTTGTLAASSVTADKISVTSLSAIKANMGTLTSGKINVGSIEINADTERILMGAATAPMTGTGVFIGKDDANYEFRCGNPAGHALHWDGTTLNIYQSGAIYVSAQQLQEATARARIYIGSTGAFAGHFNFDLTAVNKDGTLYKLAYWSAGGTKYYLGFDTAVAGGGGGTGDSCFTARTLVLMADGNVKKIVDVQIGDKVLTRESEVSSKLVTAKVLKCHEHPETDDFLMVNDTIMVTPNHRIFINGAWHRVKYVRIDDELLGFTNEKIIVKSIKRIYGKGKKVYNLEIEKYRTYFADGIYVHNAKDPG